MTDWIEWNGGEQPVADDVVVEVKFRDETDDSLVEPFGEARGFCWEHSDDAGDIIAYRIVSQPGELDRLKEALQSIQQQLMRMFASAEVDLEDEEGFEGSIISGYRIRTGAIHKILGIMVCVGYPVSIPVPSRTGIVRGSQEAEDPGLEHLRSENARLREALETMLKQFTKTPSTLKDSEIRAKAHAALGGQDHD